MTNTERLLMLFRAFHDRNDSAFYRAAQAIISDELAANHHAYAKELEQALQPDEAPRPRQRSARALTALPRDRRNGEQLVSIVESAIDATRLVLVAETQKQIDRIVDEHTQAANLARYGLSPKSKLLFWGPPGCGKTFTAHCLAQHLGLPIGLVRLNALVTSYLGETAAHIQKVFDLAQATPMVLLVDEADAIGKDRDDPLDVGELKRVVNSLLQAMDTFRSTKSIVVAASNHQHLFDPALWRRFHDIVVFPKPGIKEIRVYLRRLLNGVDLDMSVEDLAQQMKTLAFAEIEQCIQEGLKTMVLEGRSTLQADDVRTQIRQFRRARRTSRQKPRHQS